MVSHAGAALLRELAAETGLTGGVTGELLDTYRGFPVHLPGRVFADLAVAIADGADAVTGIEVLRDRESLFGPVASVPTAWRLLDRIDEPHLDRLRAVRAAARERAWAGRGGSRAGGGELRIDFDATITIAHSEKQNAAATWKKTFGFHPLLAFLDRPEVAAWGGAGRAAEAGERGQQHRRGSRQRAGHGAGRAARARPAPARGPGLAGGPGPHRRCGCHARVRRRLPQGQGCGFSFGFAGRASGSQAIVDLIPDQCLASGHRGRRAGCADGAWVAEATGMIEPEHAWPEGSRLILRKERPHPGAQLTFTDIDGHWVTAFLTDTGRGLIPGQVAGLELRHRQHARVEDRIRERQGQRACVTCPVAAGRRIMPGWRPCWPPPTWSAGPS